jgi:hypothetical protein
MNPLNDKERGLYSGLLRARELIRAACAQCRFRPIDGCQARRGDTCPLYAPADRLDREITQKMAAIPAGELACMEGE